jgi:hypothetical protein
MRGWPFCSKPTKLRPTSQLFKLRTPGIPNSGITQTLLRNRSLSTVGQEQQSTEEHSSP